MQDGNEASHDTTVSEAPLNPVTEALPSAKILEKVSLRNPNPSHAEDIQYEIEQKGKFLDI